MIERILKIQLFADEPNLQSFSDYLSSIEPIQLVTTSPDLVFDATFLNLGWKLERLTGFSSAAPVISNTLTLSGTTAQVAVRNASVIGMPILPNYFRNQPSVEYSLPVGATDRPSILSDFFSAIGKIGEQVGDAIAGVFPRTLAMVVNEAAFAVQDGVATAQDIDTAMKLGTNYPKGPLAWCDEVGADTIVAILNALAHEYGSERYRVATMLRRYAEAGMKFIA